MMFPIRFQVQFLMMSSVRIISSRAEFTTSTLFW